MRFVPVIIVAIAILAAPLVWLAAQSLLYSEGGYGGSAVDNAARIDVERLRQQVEALQEQIATLQQEVQTISSHAAQPQATAPPDPSFPHVGPNTIQDAYAQVVLIANRRNVNRDITVASPSFLKEFLGNPREDLTDNCQPMTNPKLKALLEVAQVGPITVRMLHPAVESLKRVFAKVKKVDPDLYARINTAGSLCVRRIRGTENSVSTHAFGLAVDLNIDGHLDTLGDGRTQLGLTILADFFHAEGWVWGAGFGREDSMHFEVSQQQLEDWRKEGKI